MKNERKLTTKINFGSIINKCWKPFPIEEQLKKFEELNLTDEELKWEIIINQEDKK